MKQVFVVIFCFLLGGQKPPSLIGKWESIDEEETKAISEFKENGITEINYYSRAKNVKLNKQPKLLKYSTYQEDNKWYLKFIDNERNREILSPFELKGSDTLITYHKIVNYSENDSIVTWGKDILRRVK